MLVCIVVVARCGALLCKLLIQNECSPCSFSEVLTVKQEDDCEIGRKKRRKAAPAARSKNGS